MNHDAPRREKWIVVVRGKTPKLSAFAATVRGSGIRAKIAQREADSHTWRVPLTRLDDFLVLAFMEGGLTCRLLDPTKTA